MVRAAIFGPGRGYIGIKVSVTYKATFMAIYATALAASRGLGSFGGGLIADTLDYKWVFFTSAAIGIANGLLVIFGIKNRPLTVPSTVPSQPNEPSVPEIPLYRHRPFIYQSAIATVQFIAIGISPFLALLAAEVVNLDATRIGVLFTISAVVNAVFLLPMGRLADRYSKRIMMATGLFVTAIGQAAIGLAGGFPQLAIGVVIQSTGGAMFSPAASALLSENIPLRRQNTAMGIYGACEDVGMIIGSALGGLVWSAFGPMPTFLILGTGPATVGAVMSAVLLRTRRTGNSSPILKTMSD
jgi:MFS family permease